MYKQYPEKNQQVVNVGLAYRLDLERVLQHHNLVILSYPYFRADILALMVYHTVSPMR
ncbi:hypothetical protein SDC9_175799 [bioreactor metagenome]|uniref:Uncharacterized protein n=1 Tax=bioreactor metagenome TaxID=1076179 RepID=A0A645GN70_9ZZZZ